MFSIPKHISSSQINTNGELHILISVILPLSEKKNHSNPSFSFGSEYPSGKTTILSSSADSNRAMESNNLQYFSYAFPVVR